MSYSQKSDSATNELLLQKPDHHPRIHLRAADLVLIAKKITVGVVVTAIPLVIIGGGLALTRALLHPHDSALTRAERITNPSSRR